MLFNSRCELDFMYNFFKFGQNIGSYIFISSFASSLLLFFIDVKAENPSRTDNYLELYLNKFPKYYFFLSFSTTANFTYIFVTFVTTFRTVSLRVRWEMGLTR